MVQCMEAVFVVAVIGHFVIGFRFENRSGLEGIFPWKHVVPKSDPSNRDAAWKH